MLDVFLDSLPAAIAIALSPIALIYLTLVLFSQRARVTGPVFLMTVMAAMFVVPLVTSVVVDGVTDDGSDEPATLAGWILVAFGLLLIALALSNWRKRSDTSAPKVLEKIDAMGPGAVALLAVAVTFLNPKNLVILVSTGAQAAASGEPIGTVAAALAMFVLVAALPLVVAVGYSSFGGRSAEERLEKLRRWLTGHNRVITAVVLGVIGAVLLVQGLAAVS